jgi:hypothetical protein
MTAPTEAAPTPAQIIAQADQEITAAEELAVALEDRVRDGDESIGYEEVEQARGLKRFAQLRREAAEKKAARLAADLAAAERQAVIDAHLPALEAFDASRVGKLRAEAERKLLEAAELLSGYNRHVAALAALADGAGNPFHPEDDAAITGSTRPGTLFVKINGKRFDPRSITAPAQQCLSAVESFDLRSGYTVLGPGRVR